MMALQDSQPAVQCLTIDHNNTATRDELARGILQDSLQASASNVDSLLGRTDIWDDQNTMIYLREGKIKGLPVTEKTRIRNRAALFQ
jgi:hypothetical protein